MSDPIISVENLGKRYRIDHQAQRGSYKTLREVAVARAKGLVGRFKPGRSSEELASRATREDFWALKDVSFEVKRGEVLGIIGRNGAGKSTLLKVLSRITEPTRGRVRINGRIASLLEVGTGFHPELTGRENIFLNGAILGMSKVEIKRKFDEIVAFSEVEKFLDTPVKRYSSGMYVRLAFAVAAHLEPEILIVDEVLAVGDVEFQKKCLGKMQDVSRSGRTILFVSHNMNAIETMCQRVVHLEKGRLESVSNDVGAAIARYLAVDDSENGSAEWINPGSSIQNQWFFPVRFYLGDSSGKVIAGPVRNDFPVYVYIEGEVQDPDMALNVGYGLYNDAGTLLFWSAHTDSPEADWPTLRVGLNRLRSQLPTRLLNQGSYRLDLLASLYHRTWISCPGDGAPSIAFSIQGGLSDSPYWMEQRPGVLAPVFPWSAEAVGEIASDTSCAGISTRSLTFSDV